MLHSSSLFYSTGGFWVTLHERLGALLRICMRLMTVTLCLGVIFCSLVAGILKVSASPQSWIQEHRLAVSMVAPELAYPDLGKPVQPNRAMVCDPNWDGLLVGGLWGATLGPNIPLVGGVAGPVLGATFGYLIDKNL